MLQHLVDALSLGGVYALFALGLTLVWAGLGVLNLAHGSVFMASAVGVWELASKWPGVPFVVVLLVAILIGSLIGTLIEVLILRPIQRRMTNEHQRELTTVIATVAAAALLIAIAQDITGGAPQAMPQQIFNVITYHVRITRITNIQIIIIAVSVLASAAVAQFISRTRNGRALRALALDPAMARMSGINVAALSAATMAVGGATAGVAGVLLGLQTGAVDAAMGESLLFKAFAVVIIAGVGSIRATVLAAFALAVIETAVQVYWASDLREVVVFGLIIAFLIIRPQGISVRNWQRA